MPRLTEVQYVCDYCGEAFSEPSGAVVGRISVWRAQDDPREAVSGLRRAANGGVVGRAGAEYGLSGGQAGRRAEPDARSPTNPSPQHTDNVPDLKSWSFPLPRRSETFDVALHPECADKLTYGAWFTPSTNG
jgi:hypothetical protein